MIATSHTELAGGPRNQRLTSRISCEISAVSFFWGKVGSRPISRVLSRATIHLGCTSPCTSSGLPGSTRGSRAAACAACFPIWPCSRRGLPCRRRYRRRGALLPHRFTLAVVLAHAWAVCSLLHFPWAHAPQALPGALPFGARTFLRFLAKTAVAWPTPVTNIVAMDARLKRNRRVSLRPVPGRAHRPRSCARRSIPRLLQPLWRAAGIAAGQRAFHRAGPCGSAPPQHLRR